MKKLGLFLSTAAILFTVVCLPLHYHADQKPANSSHCAVCQFSKDPRSANPSPAFVTRHYFENAITILEWVGRPVLGLRVLSASSRAPPTA